MHVFVFSYNRGRYLRNCLDALARHAPGYPVTVFDDGSDDPEVERAAAAHADWIEFVRREGDQDMYLGGLYGNMQAALTHSDDELALFIQDDQQIVRDLGAADEAHWKRFFGHYPNAIQLATYFLKPNRRSSEVHLEIDRDVPVYFRDPSRSRRTHFAAVGLFHLGRLRAWEWVFELSEGENERKAREQGIQMGFSPYPFMMWLPNAESSKFGRRSLWHRFAEWYRNVGFYPYRPMNADEVQWLRTRPVDELPMAKRCLHPEGLRREDRWLFEDATKSIRFVHRRLKKRKKREIARRQSER